MSLNSMVNRVGPTFVHRLGEITGATPRAGRARLPARRARSFGCVPLWQQIEALDNKVPDEVQAEMVIELARASSCAPRRGSCVRAACPSRRSSSVQRLAPAVAGAARAPRAGSARTSPRAVAWIAGGRAGGARRAGRMRRAPVQRARHRRDRREQRAAARGHGASVHFGVGERLGLETLRQQIELLPADSHWQSLAKLALADDLADLHRSIALDALARAARATAAQVLAAGSRRNRQALERAQRLLAELRTTPSARPGDAVRGAAGAAQPGLSHCRGLPSAPPGLHVRPPK